MKQQRKLPGILIYLLILFFSVSSFFFAVNVHAEEATQIINPGGENSNKDVKVSKRIEKTELENYFDITLTVETTTKVEEIKIPQDIAVVIVMDISNSMVSNKLPNTNITRLEEAKSAAKLFVEKFYEDSMLPTKVKAKREIGFVTYATDSEVLFNLQDVRANKDNMLDTIDNIVTKTREKRFTNMEAGLLLGNKLISSSNLENKFVIFLTDGLPTTYSNRDESIAAPNKGNADGTVGWNPQRKVTPLPTAWREGTFVNLNTGVYPSTDQSSGGTNYSEHGAQMAEKEAAKILEKGIEMYSIGIGMNSQKTLFDIRNAYTGSTLDTDTEEHNLALHNGKRIYTVAPGITDSLEEYFNANTSSKRKAELLEIWDTTDHYKRWLTNYMSSGPGYYFDSNQKGQILAAYEKIFQDISDKVEESAQAWVATDPMGVNGTAKNIEFVGFFDDNGTLKNSLINGEENQSKTAGYNTTTRTIDWDLKDSQYTHPDGETNRYKYSLKYRIRLENELSNFVENEEYNTNEETILNYVTIVNGEMSELKDINFPIPSVKGYVVDLQFTKKFKISNETTSGKLQNAKFKLAHDPDCPCQQKDNFTNKVHMSSDKSYEATSDSNGLVKFTNVASGHKYILTETEAPTDYNKSEKTTKIEVKYNQVIGTINEDDYINTIKTGNLKITKEVQGNKEYAGNFKFEIKVFHNNKTLIGNYKYKKVDANGEATTGTINLQNDQIILKDGESITIKGLPVGATYKIQELTTNGYTVKHKINDKDVTNGATATCSSTDCDINNGGTQTVNFYNIAGYILPATGDSGMLILVIIASLLLIGPIIDIGYMFYKNRKEDKLTS